jgi:hypothetical protein
VLTVVHHAPHSCPDRGERCSVVLIRIVGPVDVHCWVLLDVKHTSSLVIALAQCSVPFKMVPVLDIPHQQLSGSLCG